MPRAVEEWRGKNDDAQVPPRVRLRVFERCGGRCHRCSRKINAGESWTLEHLIALINGGLHRESNFGITCNWCLPAKNAEDVKEKAKVYAIRSKHTGARKPKRTIPGRRFNGEPIPARWK